MAIRVPMAGWVGNGNEWATTIKWWLGLAMHWELARTGAVNEPSYSELLGLGSTNTRVPNRAESEHINTRELLGLGPSDSFEREFCQGPKASPSNIPSLGIGRSSLPLQDKAGNCKSIPLPSIHTSTMASAVTMTVLQPPRLLTALRGPSTPSVSSLTTSTSCSSSRVFRIRASLSMPQPPAAALFQPSVSMTSFFSGLSLALNLTDTGTGSKRGDCLVVKAGRAALCLTKRSRSRKSLARTHGFRRRMRTTGGRAILKRRRAKGRWILCTKTHHNRGK
ncbi:Large ribosomal subunit protein bL34c-like protein [Drosera capensis]